MLDNFIRGGQLFLHNVAMFKQVIAKVFAVSFIVGVLVTSYIASPRLAKLDFPAGMSYARAYTVDWIHEHRLVLHRDSLNAVPRIDAYDKRGLFYKAAYTGNIIKHPKFKKAFAEIKAFSLEVIILALAIAGAVVAIVFLLWSKFGKSAKETKVLDGSKVLTAKEVATYLNSKNQAGEIIIDGMPLIKGQETRHILVTGMTGSGKTNLLNKVLPQVRSLKQPAIVIDQTGEMIARYYDQARGDIIFNPLDRRSKTWDFWTDCSSGLNEFGVNERLEKFAKVLIGSSRKAHSYTSDPFWENSAEVIFTSCVQYLLEIGKPSIKDLKHIIGNWTLQDFKINLAGTRAARYLCGDNATTASSILSVMSTRCSPLFYLPDTHYRGSNHSGGKTNGSRGNREETSKEKIFSLKDYFASVAQGSDSWLFLSTPPDQREVIIPLLSCIIELAVSYLISTDIDEKRRVWFVTDELASLGRLSSFNTLMTEGRKYGACVLAALQSYNQLLFNYGQYMGSTLFGQFATKVIFRCNEPVLAKLMSDSFGNIEYRQQQKNTSYGANEHRDGISYTEQERTKPLIAASKFMELKDLECYVALPDPSIKVAQLQLQPVTNVPTKNSGFEPLPSPNTSKERAEAFKAGFTPSTEGQSNLGLDTGSKPLAPESDHKDEDECRKQYDKDNNLLRLTN